MNESLDVRRAIREANSVFSRFPVQVCVPMLLFGVASYATIGRLQPTQHHYFLIVMVAAFCTFWLDCFAQVVVASMCLRAREGTVPGGAQASEALHYRGLGNVIWGLLFRYLGWILVFALIVGVIGGLAAIISLGIPGAATPHLVVIAVIAIVFGVIGAVIFCRYILVLPMLAIAGGSEPGFLDQCVRRTLQVWKTVALVMVAGGAPFFVIAGIEFLVWHDLNNPLPPHGAHLAVQLIGMLFIDCYGAWFILVKTGLAMQLMSATLPVPPQPFADSAGTVDRIGPPSF